MTNIAGMKDSERSWNRAFENLVGDPVGYLVA